MQNNQQSIPSVALVGAFDRFNYGDLLFPIISKNHLLASGFHGNIPIHALLKSDLSAYGALPTESIVDLNSGNVLRPGDTVIFAGGGTIGVDWTYMYSNLCGRFGNAALYYSSRLFGSSFVNRYSMKVLGGRSPFPWVAGPADFPCPVNVAYNAVGGSEFSNLSRDQQKLTLERLSQATYLSVRDAETQRHFAPLNDSITVELAPDSAVLMSEQFPIEWLEKNVSSEIRDLVDAGGYICFQSNIHYANRNQSKIIAALEELFNKTGLRAVLLPIGRYVGLDDQMALSLLQQRLQTPSALVSDSATIFEIMYVIAKANLFLGTSLHGNITSQSFGVPHLGLSETPCKVDFYLDTWDLPEQARCVQLESLTEFAKNAMGIPEERRLKKRDELIALAKVNFERLFNSCGIISDATRFSSEMDARHG